MKRMLIEMRATVGELKNGWRISVDEKQGKELVESGKAVHVKTKRGKK